MGPPPHSRLRHPGCQHPLQCRCWPLGRPMLLSRRAVGVRREREHPRDRQHAQGRRRHPRRRPLPSPGGVSSVAPARGDGGVTTPRGASSPASPAACVSAEARRRAVRTCAIAITRRSAGTHPRRRSARPSPAPTQKWRVRGRRARGGRRHGPNFRERAAAGAAGGGAAGTAARIPSRGGPGEKRRVVGVRGRGQYEWDFQGRAIS